MGRSSGLLLQFNLTLREEDASVDLSLIGLREYVKQNTLQKQRGQKRGIK